ncbi:MAG: prepilin-type N-terminal cleavage/methylation domain-containing protein [Syntrophales bacterium LBB04]|nr:prepilin-type N-terminal cleavage/methylation domain-containing protein [Syntrophales bacterium LBB04]
MIVNRRQNGFTLLELVISMSLLTIALLGLCSTSVMVIKGNSISRMSTKATILAKDKIEFLKNFNYGSIASGTDTQEGIYARSWTITSDSPVTGTKTIVVTVSFPWLGINRSVTLNTIISS